MNTDILQGTIAYYIQVRHMKGKADLCMNHTTIGNYKTFKKYIEDPSKMPLGIFEEIMDALNVPKEERIKILFDK